MSDPDPALVIDRLSRFARKWAGRYRSALGNVLEPDDLLAEAWLVYDRTGSFTRACGSIRDVLRSAVRADRRHISVEVPGPPLIITPAVQDVLLDPRERAWALRSRGALHREIAAELGRSGMTISRWLRQMETERGRIDGVLRYPTRRIASPTLDRIARVVGLSTAGPTKLARELGVSRITVRRAIEKTRGPNPRPASNLSGTHCVRGHPLAETLRARGTKGKRDCAKCTNIVRRRTYQQKVYDAGNFKAKTDFVNDRFCVWGHDLSVERRTRPNGTHYCLGCKRAYWRKQHERGADKVRASTMGGGRPGPAVTHPHRRPQA